MVAGGLRWRRQPYSAMEEAKEQTGRKEREQREKGGRMGLGRV